MGWGKRSKKRNFEWIGLKVVLCWLKLLLFEKFQETTTALENRVMVYKLVLIICWTWSSKFRGRLFIWWLFNHIMRLDREILKKKTKKNDEKWRENENWKEKMKVAASYAWWLRGGWTLKSAWWERDSPFFAGVDCGHTRGGRWLRYEIHYWLLQ